MREEIFLNRFIKSVIRDIFHQDIRASVNNWTTPTINIISRRSRFSRELRSRRCGRRADDSLCSRATPIKYDYSKLTTYSNIKRASSTLCRFRHSPPPFHPLDSRLPAYAYLRILFFIYHSNVSLLCIPGNYIYIGVERHRASSCPI